MKNNGSSGTSKGQGGNGIAYGQPYLQNTGGEGGSSAHRVGANSNLKSYINELKKASNANKTGGKRGYSSSRQGPAAVGTANVLRQQQQAVVQTYGGSMPQTTKNTVGNSAQFVLDYPNGTNQVQIQSQKGQRNGASQQQLSELALKDNVTGVMVSKNNSSNLTQLVSPSQTFVRTNSRQGNGQTRALSNGQITTANQNNQAHHVLSPQNSMPQGTNSQFGPLVAATSTSNVRQPAQQQFLAGFISPQGTNQMMNQTQQIFSQSASKINAGNASSKAFQYLQKKGNLQNANASGCQQVLANAQDITASADRTSNHLIKRIASGRKQLMQGNSSQDPNAPTNQRANRKSNTRGAPRNQSQQYAQSASQQALQNIPASFGGQQVLQNQSKSKQQAGGDQRMQKDVIIRKNSSKSLLPATGAQQQAAGAMPNIQNVKGKQDKNATSNGVLLLKTESMDRETANTSKIGANQGSNHKRVTSHPNTYVKIQNSEVSSAGTTDAGFQGGLPNNNYTTAGQQSRGHGGGIPHTLGNTLGGNPKQSLNMSNYGGYFSAIQRDSSLNENNTLAKTGINLSSLIRQNLLEEDGIEDLHFYFVSFQQHKKQILSHQKRRQEVRMKQQAGPQGNSANGPRMVVPKIPINTAGRGVSNNAASSSGSTRNMLNSKMSPVSRGEIDTSQNKTIESLDDEDFL